MNIKQKSIRKIRSAEEPGKDKGAPRKQAYLTFAIVSLALLMSSIDTTIVAVSLPTILNDLQTNLAWVGWILTGYQFSQSIIMPIAGKLSDDWGRKRLFLAAAILFTISSVAAGLAPNIFSLIIFRIIQGIGGGVFLPSATGIISDAFGERRAPAIGLFGSIFPIGGVMGTAGIVLALSYFPDKALGMQEIYLGLAFLLLLLIPIVFLIPDSARQRRNRLNSTPE